MKLTFSKQLACGLAALTSLTVIADDYPHAFPREGTKQLFDNERVTAWEVLWKTGVAQPIHRHRYDMAGVYLRYGPIHVTSPEGVASPQRPAFEVPRPYFQLKGITHREEMIGFPPGTAERLAIMFDLKEVSKPAVAVPPGIPAAFPRQGATKAIDNERVIEWDHAWSIGQAIPQHMHDKDSVQVFFEPGTIKFTNADGTVETRTFAFGDARFIPAGTVDTEEALAGSPRAVTIELK